MISEFLIHIDLDGVLADFAKKVCDIMDLPYIDDSYSLRKINKGAMWAAIARYKQGTFFLHLDKMPDADDLLTYLSSTFAHDTISILTASGRTPAGAAEQKRQWVKKMIGDYHVDVVVSGDDKAKFATPKSILIDDKKHVVESWIAGGGIGVLHTSTKETIRQLQEIINHHHIP